MPIALKSIAPYRATSQIKFVFSILILFLAPPLFANTEANISITNIGYLPNEATALDLKRDLEIEDSIKFCKNLNESASWFDVCSQLQTATGQNTTILFDGTRFQDAQAPKEKNGNTTQFLPPLVEVHNKSGEIFYFRFLQMARRNFAIHDEQNKNSLQNVSARLSFDTAKREASCELSVDDLDDQIVRKEWVLKRFPKNNTHAENQLIIDNDVLSFEYFKGFDSVSCQYVLFDGLLFKRIQTTQFIRAIEVIPNRASLPVRIQSLDDFYLISLEHTLGPRETDKPYSCVQTNDDPLLPNICQAFDLLTGHISESFKTSLLLQTVLRESPTVHTLKISKHKLGGTIVEIPLEIEVSPTKTIADTYKTAKEVPVLRTTMESTGPRLACDTSALLAEKRSMLVSWKINNQVFQGWSASILNSLLVAFGNTYACGVDDQWSNEVVLDTAYLTLLGVDRAIFLASDERLLISVEPNLYLGEVKRSWECETSDKNITCEFLDSDRNMRRVVEVKRTNKSAKNYASTLKIHLSIDGFSTAKKELVKEIILQTEDDKTYVDISSHIKLTQDAGARLQCEIDRPSEEFNNSNIEVSWTINGKPIASSSRYLAFEKTFVSQNISCLMKIRKGNFYGIGLATLKAESPQPQFQNLPDLIAFDLQHENNMNFEILDRYNALSKAKCYLIHNEDLLTDDLCTLVKSNSKIKNIQLLINAADIQKVSHIAQQLSRIDPYFLTGFEVAFSLETPEKTIIKRVHARLFKPNTKPKILFAHHYIDEHGMQICRFAIADPNNDHLNVKLYFNADPAHPLSFSTFERGATEILKSENNEVGKQLIRTGIAKAKRTHRTRPGCSLMVSDGVLFSSLSTTFKRNAFDSDIDTIQIISKAKTEPAKLVPVQSITVDLKTPTRIQHLEASNVGSGTEDLQTALQIKDFYISREKKEFFITDEKFKKSKTSVLACIGKKRICGRITISENKIVVNTDGLQPTEELILVVREAKHRITFYGLVMHLSNTLSTTEANCFLSEEQLGTTFLDTEVNFENKAVFIPNSLFTYAMALGFHVPACKKVLETQLQTSEQQKLATNIYLPKNRVISALNLLYRAIDLLPELSLAGQFKLTDCHISNGRTEETCKYNSENLLILLPASPEKGNFNIATKISYNIAGVLQSRNMLIKVFDPNSKNFSLKPSLKAIPDIAREQIHCLASGIDHSEHQFELYEGQSLIGRLNTMDPIATFNINIKDANDIYICQLKSSEILISSSTALSEQNEVFESTCFTDLFETVSCSSTIASKQLRIRRLDEVLQYLDRDFSSAGQFIKIRTRSQNSHLVSSETIELPHSIKSQSADLTIVESVRIYLSNPFLNRPTCFNGYSFQSDPSTDVEYKTKIAAPSCSEASLADAFADSKKSDLISAQRWFYPDSDVLLDETATPRVLKKWIDFFDFQTLNGGTTKMRKLICKSSDQTAAVGCMQFASALRQSIPASEKMIIEQETGGFIKKKTPYKALLNILVSNVANETEQEFESVYFY